MLLDIYKLVLFFFFLSQELKINNGSKKKKKTYLVLGKYILGQAPIKVKSTYLTCKV